jgi:hypothetical protein
MKRAQWTMLGLAAAAILGVTLAARSATHAPLQSERVLLENARVRVLEYTSRPSGNICGLGTHTHPPHLTIVLAPARDRSSIVGGKAEEAEMKFGDVYWSDGETHTDVNIGATRSRVIVVEIK